MFDLSNARKDGHDDASIAEFLAGKHHFDLEQARKDGVTDTQVAEFLAPRKVPTLSGRAGMYAKGAVSNLAETAQAAGAAVAEAFTTTINPDNVMEGFTAPARGLDGRSFAAASKQRLAERANIKQEKRQANRGAIGPAPDMGGTGTATGNLAMKGLARAKQGTTLAMHELGLTTGGDEMTAARLADQQRKIESYDIPESILQGQAEIAAAEGFTDALQAIVDNPKAVIGVTLESLGASAPALLGGVAGSFAGPTGTAAGVGAGSFAVEYTATLSDVFSEAGLPMTDVRSWALALKDKELVSRAREKATKRGIPIAAFDAVTAGIAGRFIGALRSGAGLGAKTGAVVAEGATQAIGGAAGEKVAQGMTGENNWGDVLLEAFAEVPSALVEAPANARHARARADTDLTTGMQADPAAIQQAAVQALDPSHAQLTEPIRQVATDILSQAPMSTDPVESAVVQLEQQAAQRALQPPPSPAGDLGSVIATAATLDEEQRLAIARQLASHLDAAVPIDQSALLQRAQAAAAAVPEVPVASTPDAPVALRSNAAMADASKALRFTGALVAAKQAAPDEFRAEALRRLAVEGFNTQAAAAAIDAHWTQGQEPQVQAIESEAMRRGILPSPAPRKGPTDGLIRMSSGAPFRSEHLAKVSARQKTIEATPVQVDGGWALQPTPVPEQVATAPAPSPAPEEVLQREAPTPGLLMNAKGEPFRTEKMAASSAWQRKLPATPVQVPGGWALQPVESRPVEAKPNKKHSARRLLLEQVTQAGRETDPVLTVEYEQLMAELATARKEAGLKKTPRKRATELSARANRLEVDDLPRLREQIGYSVFRLGSSSYKVLRTPENLARFARKVRASEGFTGWQISPEEAYDHAQVRPGTTEEQKAEGRDVLEALHRRLFAHRGRTGGSLGRGQISVLGSAFYEGFTENGGVALTGQTVETPEDLAVLAQVFRDPRFETFRVFYTDEDGRILNEAGYSSRLPGLVRLPDNLHEQIARELKDTSATGYWILHNHPSGRSAPSESDIQLTRQTAAAVPGFLGHVVIDHNEFATIAQDGSARVVSAPHLEGIDFTSRPELEHSLLGTTISSPDDVADLAKALQIGGGHATVILTRRQGQVHLIADLPAALLMDVTKVGRAKLKGVLRRVARSVGAGGHRFVVLPAGVPSNAYRTLILDGIFADVVTADGASLRASTPAGADFMEKNVRQAVRLQEPYTRTDGWMDALIEAGGHNAWVRARDAGETALEEGAWLQVRTGEFKQWFGEWEHGRSTAQAMADGARGGPEGVSTGAKTNGAQDAAAHRRVDPVTLDPTTGEPRIFHLAANDPLTVDFEHRELPHQGWLGTGIYLNTDHQVAQMRAQVRSGSGTEHVFVRAQHVFPVDAEILEKLRRVAPAIQRAFARRLRKAGFDGAAVPLDTGAVELVTFSPLNVREAASEAPIDTSQVAEELPDYEALGSTIEVDGVQRPATNSKGQPIAQTEEAIRNFWRWFGQSVMTVSGKPGDAPLVLYHGTRQDFTAFRDDRAIMLTPSPKYAESFTGNEVGSMMALYARIENPHYTEDQSQAEGIPYWMTGDELRAGDYDGLIYSKAGEILKGASGWGNDIPQYAVFSPEQIKSATGNNGAFDPTDPNVTREEVPGYEQTLDAPPEETTFRRVQRRWQDKFNRFSVIQDWLKEHGVALTDQANVYRAEERMHGRTATQIEDFREERVKPLIARIRKAGFSMAEVADFLHAQHAEERNAQIARINQDMPDGGSGMSNAEAQAKLAEYRKVPELMRLANELQSITDDTRELLLRSGIITPEMSEAWQKAYSHYVPLKGGPDTDTAQQGTGRGLTVKQKNRRALGHGQREEWIVENILRDHERAILQVEKNRVGQHLLTLALEAGHPDLVTIGQPTKRQALRDAKAYAVSYHGSVVEVFQSLGDAQRYVGQEALRAGRQRNDFAIETTHDLSVVMMPSPVLEPNETQVYVDGHAIRVQFKDELLGRAWNNMGAEAMNVVFRAARSINTWLSKAYTGWNPEFLAVNMMRDLSTGVLNLSGEQGALFAGKVLTNYPKGFSELLRYAFGGNPSKWIKQYRADGGTTGAAYLSDLERVGKDVEAAYDTYAGALDTLQRGGPRRAARAAARESLGWFVGWIERINQAGENAMRLAAYRTAVEQGQSRASAAALAKNSTVNFNRRGELGQVMGAMYLFFNPAVQGGASIAHALFKGKHKTSAQALTAGLVGLGYFFAASMGGGPEDEWDKLGENMHDRYLTLWTGDGWVNIPIPYGYGFFIGLGRQLHALERGEDPAKVSVRLAASFVSEFSVWSSAVDTEGDEKNLFFLLPTIPQAALAPVINRTGLGTPIYPESPFDSSQPDNLKMWRSTQGTLWADSAQALNAITGGSAVEKGWLDISPETLKYLWATATGGTGRFFVDSVTLADNIAAEGLELSDVESREVPILRKFVRSAGDVRGTRAQYWRKAEEVKEAVELFRRVRRVEDYAERSKLTRRIAAEKGELFALGKAMDKFNKAIRAKRDQIQAVIADDSRSLSHRRALVRKLEKEEAALYDQFVAIVADQKKEK